MKIIHRWEVPDSEILVSQQIKVFKKPFWGLFVYSNSVWTYFTTKISSLSYSDISYKFPNLDVSFMQILRS